MRVAIIKNNLVTNIIEVENLSTIPGAVPADGWHIGDVYNEKAILTWELNAAKFNKTTELKWSCENSCLAGFTSIATGNILTYPSKLVDQMQIHNAFNAATVIDSSTAVYKLMCANSDGEWSRRDHSLSQLKQVVFDLNVHISNQTTKLDDLLDKIQQSNNIDEITEICW